jgi:DNA-binding transcriptional LysR family regulator
MSTPPRNFDWTRARAFLATAEEGSLSAAARRLGLTQPTLGRQVAGLEEELGVLLFERAGNALTLTQAGTELLAPARAMGDAADRMAIAATGQAQAVDGLVRITASDLFSTYLLPPVLRKLRARAPKLEIEVIAVNDLQDLMRREADIAIRHVRPTQPELIARMVREAEAHLYAAPAYLDRTGRPEDLAALATHDFIAFGPPERMIGFLEPLGVPVQRENFRLFSENGLVAWEMVRQGFGIAPMSADIGEASGMERVVPDMAPITFPIWLTTHRELHTSRRIRLVFDLLAEGFAG